MVTVEVTSPPNASIFTRKVSVPFGITAPNISSTRWRTVADHKRKALLLRIGVDSKHVLGRSEAGRFFEPDGQGEEARFGKGPKERIFRERREGL
jgi:hypothetical protein